MSKRKNKKTNHRQAILIVLAIFFGFITLLSYVFLQKTNQTTTQVDYLKASVSDSGLSLQEDPYQWKRFEFDQIPINLGSQDSDTFDAIPAVERSISFSGKRTLQTKTGILTQEELDESKISLKEALILRQLEDLRSSSEFVAIVPGTEKVDFFDSDIPVGTVSESYVVGFEGSFQFVIVPKDLIFYYLGAQYGVSVEYLPKYAVQSFSIRKEKRQTFAHIIFSSEPEKEGAVLLPEETE